MKSKINRKLIFPLIIIGIAFFIGIMYLVKAVNITTINDDGYIVGAGTRTASGAYILVAQGVIGNARGYIEFNTSSIPDSATITGITLQINYTGNFSGGYFTQMEIQPSSSYNNLSIFDDIGNGTNYAFWVASDGAGINNYDLGSQAIIDLQNLLSSDWFAIGINATVNQSGFDQPNSFASSESTSPPILIVTYTTSAGVTQEINVGGTEPILNYTNNNDATFNVSSSDGNNCKILLGAEILGINYNNTQIQSLANYSMNLSLINNEVQFSFQYQPSTSTDAVNSTNFKPYIDMINCDAFTFDWNGINSLKIAEKGG